MTDFRGIPGHSSVMSRRYAKEARDEIDSRMDEVIDSCRTYLMGLYQQNRDEELSDNYIKNEIINYLLKESSGLSLGERERIAGEIFNELRGFGPVTDIIKDPKVTDVVIINWDRILYEKKGVIHVLDKTFRDEKALRTMIEKLCYLGRGRVDESNPEASITVPGHPNNYRVSIQIPPLTTAATLSIRKFTEVDGLREMVNNGTYSPEAAQFFIKAVKGRANIFFSGSMGTGKTTQIAVAGEYFAPDEKNILIEEVMECPLKHPNLRRLVARPPNIEGKGEIKFGRLLKAALQMSATRVLVAEVRDGALFFCLQAMNIGHFGSMGTGHANSPHDLIYYRMPGMLRMAEETKGMDKEDMLSYICSALHVIVQLGREGDKRVCKSISEVVLDPPGVKDIFVRRDGELVATGYYPERVAEVLSWHGVNL